MRKRRVLLPGVISLWLAACQVFAQTPGAPAPQPYTRIANPDTNTVQLQIALRKFVPAENAGPAIWLAGVMHIGEPAYYRDLQHFLDGQTVVLYEGIDPDAHPRHFHDTDKAATNAPPSPSAHTGGDYSMQSALARSLGLVFQLDAIDYDRANFLNSDLSVLQIQRVMNEGHPAGASGGTNDPLGVLLQIMDGSSFLGSIFKVGLQFVAASPQLQAVAKLTLIEAVGQLKGDLSDIQDLPLEWKKLIQVLIKARNENLLADLTAELKKIPPSGSIAVFYGTGHMDDLEKRITTDLHYRPADDIWLSAFSVDLRKSGISPTEAQLIKQLIQSQMKQMYPH